MCVWKISQLLLGLIDEAINSTMKLPAIALLYLLVFIYTVSAQAAIQCYDCHGIRGIFDSRPADDQFRNLSTGGFPGNHSTHMAAPGSPAACSKCHPGSDKYTSSHRDGMIKLSSNINNSPLTAVYKNSTSAWQQTPLPLLGACTNVNCHFETTTPSWGTVAFSSTDQCSQCHGGPVALTMSHTTHQRYSTSLMGKFSTFTACATCHVNYTSPLNFQHATSAGNRPINVTVGSYNSGSTTYLPSQSHGAFGTCTNLYCHSPGNKTSNFDPPNRTATWGGSLTCNGCHKDSAGDPMVSGSHPIHLLRGYGCAVCHAATVSDNTTIRDTAKHVTGSPSVSFSGSYSSMLYDSGAKTCSGACHSDGRGGSPKFLPVWGSPNSHGCGFCHGMPPTTGAHAKHMPQPASYGLLPADYTSAAVLSTVADYVFGCANCHPKDLSKHVNGIVEVSLDNRDDGTLKSKNGAADGTSGYTQSVKTSVVCTASYCHSNGMASLTYSASPDWYGTFTGDPCAMCHGNSPNSGGKTGSSPHYNTNSYAMGVTGGHLASIHYRSVFNNATSNLPSAGSGTEAGHGNSGASTTMNCNVCHYATVTPFYNDKGTLCATCHNGTSATLRGSLATADLDHLRHLNGVVDIAFIPQKIRSKAQWFANNTSIWKRSGTLKAAGSYDEAAYNLSAAGGWNTGTKSCSNIVCHNNYSINWDSKDFHCSACHGADGGTQGVYDSML